MIFFFILLIIKFNNHNPLLFIRMLKGMFLFCFKLNFKRNFLFVHNKFNVIAKSMIFFYIVGLFIVIQKYIFFETIYNGKIMRLVYYQTISPFVDDNNELAYWSKNEINFATKLKRKKHTK